MPYFREHFGGCLACERMTPSSVKTGDRLQHEWPQGHARVWQGQPRGVGYSIAHGNQIDIYLTVTIAPGRVAVGRRRYFMLYL